MSKTKQQPPHKCFIDTTQKINDMGLIKIICQTIRLQYLSLVITETINPSSTWVPLLQSQQLPSSSSWSSSSSAQQKTSSRLSCSFPNTLFFFQGKWRAEELYTTAPRLHKSWPKALAVTWHTIKRNSNSNVSNVRKTDRWIQLCYTVVRYISYHQQRR